MICPIPLCHREVLCANLTKKLIKRQLHDATDRAFSFSPFSKGNNFTYMIVSDTS